MSKYNQYAHEAVLFLSGSISRPLNKAEISIPRLFSFRTKLRRETIYDAACTVRLHSAKI